jgi:hypothetical protein
LVRNRDGGVSVYAVSDSEYQPGLGSKVGARDVRGDGDDVR